MVPARGGTTRPIVQIGSPRPLPDPGDRPIVAVALGAGAVRGFAHVGVLQALGDAGIPVDLIVGTSVGAFVGALWATDPNFETLEARYESFLRTPEARKTIFGLRGRSADDEGRGFLQRALETLKDRYTFGKAVVGQSILPRSYMENAVLGMLPDRDIATTKIPFACTAVDIRSAQEVIFTGGPIRTAVLASSSIPGVLPPYEMGERLLVDGACMGGLPVNACRVLGADFVIGVDVRRAIGSRIGALESGVEVVVRADGIAAYFLTQTQVDRADYVLQPKVGHLEWAEFAEYRSAFEAGHTACVPEIEDISAAIRDWKPPRDSWWSRIRRRQSSSA